MSTSRLHPYFLVAEPNPPVNLSITVDGLSLVATWSEPFSLEGEQLSYIIFITSSSDLIQDAEVSVNESQYEYVFSESIEGMDCTQYIMFTVFSENEYSRSIANVSERKSVPKGILLIYHRESVYKVSFYMNIIVSCTISC